MKIYQNLDEIIEAQKSLEKKWEEVKLNSTVPFPSEVEKKFRELKRLIKRSYIGGIKGSISMFNAANILNELEAMYLKGHADLDYIMDFSGTNESLKTFKKYNHLLGDQEYWERLALSYVTQDYEPIPYKTLVDLFNSDRPGKDFLMSNEEKELLNKLPPVITIYRAMTKKELKSGKFRLSWTLSKSVAEKFLNRNKHLYDDMTIHEIEIPKEKITAYFISREEEEIIYIK